MFVVYFFDNKNLLLTQLLQRVPSVGEDLKIKGRKGKVSSVTSVDEQKFQVQIVLEAVNKNKQAAAVDNSKKKKR
ncbi:hypothetical protein IEC97_15315 [Neobacillus cucumis]|uniref:hypothetical protein n=1 Tax=Neobacillus cucumis TaxID=1740721 RepID=UPI0018DFC948|nr:hypothetical protein [Neobacillus cucumis]MBI0578732.1 hypothetical protein [Neobacillus cucumis]WHY92531.1 hypothetical protein QNK12_03195 [Neobacillus cucumis]